MTTSAEVIPARFSHCRKQRKPFRALPSHGMELFNVTDGLDVTEEAVVEKASIGQPLKRRRTTPSVYATNNGGAKETQSTSESRSQGSAPASRSTSPSSASTDAGNIRIPSHSAQTASVKQWKQGTPTEIRKGDIRAAVDFLQVAIHLKGQKANKFPLQKDMRVYGKLDTHYQLRARQFLQNENIIVQHKGTHVSEDHGNLQQALDFVLDLGREAGISWDS